MTPATWQEFFVSRVSAVLPFRTPARMAEDRDEREEVRLSKYLAIALGGALGSLARFWVGSAVAARLGTRFWYGTLIINVSACAIIGFALTVMARRADFNPLWRYFFPIGFVGAYSTFSTFEWEIFAGVGEGAFLRSAVYLVSSLVLGFLGVWVGALLGQGVA